MERNPTAPIMRSVPNEKLIEIQQETLCGAGDYEATRALVNAELARRANILYSLRSVDMPVWDEEVEE